MTDDLTPADRRRQRRKGRAVDGMSAVGGVVAAIAGLVLVIGVGLGSGTGTGRVAAAVAALVLLVGFLTTRARARRPD